MLCTALCALMIVLVIYRWFQRQNPNYPPCPSRPWPILGHLLILEETPREQFKKFRKQCGNIFSLYLGTTHVVILNGTEVVKEAFINQGDDFSDRADFFLNKALHSAGTGIVNGNGEIWKEQRTASISILRKFGLGKNILVERTQEELSCYMALLHSLKGEPVDVNAYTYVSISNTVCSLIVGKRFEYNDEQFTKMVRLLGYNFAHMKGTALLNYFPLLRFLPGDVFKFKIIEKNFQDFFNMFAKVYVKENENIRGDPTNYISGYLQKMEKKQLAGEITHLNKQNILRCIFDIFAAGTETTSNTILWILLYLINYPQVQEKAIREIEVVVGLDRTPTMQDKSKLNYLVAVIMEVQRLSSVLPMTLPRTVKRDLTIGGYVIPKGAHILANMDSMLHDQAAWGNDADKFRPERFISKDGSLLHPEDWVPFSFGKRACLGEGLAKMQLFLYIASLLQKFKFLPANESDVPPIKGNYGLNNTPQAFEVRLISRSC